MLRWNDLDVNSISTLRAIYKRGHLFKGAKELGKNIFGSSLPGQSVKSFAKTGLKFIKPVFNLIDENGNIPSIKFVPEYEKKFLREFLKEIKESFKNFNDIQEIVQEFLNKDEKQ